MTRLRLAMRILWNLLTTSPFKTTYVGNDIASLRERYVLLLIRKAEASSDARLLERIDRLLGVTVAGRHGDTRDE